MRLTKRACDELARMPPAAARDRPVRWDDEVPGFGARLNAHGKVSFVIKYRVKGDPRQRLVTLGAYGPLSVEKARDEAAAIRAAAGLGRDLLAERQAEADRATAARREAALRAVPLADLLDGWRASVEAALAGRAARGEGTSYERETLRLEARVIRPGIGAATAGGLDPARFQAMVSLQPTPNHRRNLRAALVRFVRWANAEMVRRGVPVRWPTSFEVEGRPRTRSHRFTLAEAAHLWVAAGGLGRRGALVRMMLLTGSRRGEVAQMAWADLRLDDPVLGPHWQQPARITKTDQPHRVPLSGPAVALLRWLPPRLTKKAGPSPLVFAGRGGKVVGGWTDVRRALLEAAGVDAGTLHDVRRTLVSTLGDHGFDPQVADALLNHAAASTMGGVMGVYQRSEMWKKRREAIDLWTGLLVRAVGEAQGRPVDPETWGFAGEFRDARIVRPGRGAAGYAARAPLGLAGRSRSRSQAARSSGK